VRAQLVEIADARQHQQLRRVDRAARENHLTLRPHDGLLAMPDVFDADDTGAVEQQPGHQRLDLHGQVAARQRRAQIGDRAAAAPAMLDRHLHACKAVLLGAVVILGRRQAGSAGSIHIGVAKRILVARRFRHQRTVAPAIGVASALPALLPPEIRQRMRVGPTRQTCRRPAVVIGAIAANIGHRVDRR
jgi:hypothetical protein